MKLRTRKRPKAKPAAPPTMARRILAQDRARRWLAENRKAIAAYNRGVEAHGVWSDGWRRW